MGLDPRIQKKIICNNQAQAWNRTAHDLVLRGALTPGQLDKLAAIDDDYCARVKAVIEAG